MGRWMREANRLQKDREELTIHEPPVSQEGVKMPLDPIRLSPGANITWDSPLFGNCIGEVAMAPEGGWVVVRTHSVTGNLALVKLDWGVRRVKG